MKKHEAIDQAWRIATLTEPGGDVRELLYDLEFERVLELLLILRQSPKPVQFPAGFVRRAIESGWTAATLPEKIERRDASVPAVKSRPEPIKPSDYPEQPTVSDEEFAEYVRRAEKMKADKEAQRGAERQPKEHEGYTNGESRGVGSKKRNWV